jgi:hypothetical protein
MIRAPSEPELRSSGSRGAGCSSRSRRAGPRSTAIADAQPDQEHAAEIAGDAYGALIADQLAGQRARKESFERRGFSVITSSGVVVSVLLGIAALIVTGDEVPPVLTRSYLISALLAGHASVEPSGSWFVPHLQAHYEELRHGREVEHAYSEAMMEYHRRTREIAEEEQRRENERRIAREMSVQAAQKEREKEVLARRTMFAKREAMRIVADRLEAGGLTLKHIPEPQRTQLLLEEEDRVMMRA